MGKTGITCVNTEGEILPKFTSLNMISAINPRDACNIQKESKGRQIALSHLTNERQFETSLNGKNENPPHANGELLNVFTCETNVIISPTPLRTQIEQEVECYTMLYSTQGLVITCYLSMHGIY